MSRKLRFGFVDKVVILCQKHLQLLLIIGTYIYVLMLKCMLSKCLYLLLYFVAWLILLKIKCILFYKMI